MGDVAEFPEHVAPNTASPASPKLVKLEFPLLAADQVRKILTSLQAATQVALMVLVNAEDDEAQGAFDAMDQVFVAVVNCGGAAVALKVIPRPADQNRCAHSRSPMDMIRQG